MLTSIFSSLIQCNIQILVCNAVLIICIGSTCGYTNGDNYTGEEYATTRELPCNLKMREGDGTIRITKEEGVIAEDSKNSIAIPVYDLYECGLDSDCVDNTCQLMGSEDVKCRCCNLLHTYQR